ncbi:Rnf213, partial [Symbiodinium microadriaticum]
MGGHNCITKDSVMKMIALFSRLRCGIPVVLMGECGLSLICNIYVLRCGKTQLIEYTCAYWGVPLYKLDCHGGTTSSDIETLFDMVEARCQSEIQRADHVFVFLDEINTCVHIDLITEIIMNHSINGRKLHSRIVVLGALNPYRWNTAATNDVAGLNYEHSVLAPSALPSAGRLSSGVDRNLVYKVHPIPDTLLCFIYDFGALDSHTEGLYITAMIQRELKHRGSSTGAFSREMQMFADALQVAQAFSRRVGGDASVVSLRDVKRCIQLVNWFESNSHNHNSRITEREKPLSWAGAATLRSYVLAMALVYHYRLQEREYRLQLWSLISAGQLWPLDTQSTLAVVSREEQLFCDNLKFEEDIATNEALRENVFVTITCVSNKIPVILVGKPGSSKTLTISVIESNLRGDVSVNVFWRDFPAVTVFSYQCSPLSKAQGILNQYHKACRFQESQNSRRSVTILLLDEIGLAEHSPDMPLKILHQLLPEEKVAVIGISNWVLDPAKMNRAVLINRPDPTAADLELTGAAISNIRLGAADKGTSTALNATILKCLAQAFHEVYTLQAERPFFGMRDYYSLLKLIRRSKEKSLGWKVLMRAICRNFGGKMEFLDGVISAFMRQYAINRSVIGHLFGASLDPTPLSTFVMIAENLNDKAARHLMVITNNKIAFPVMVGCGLLTLDNAEVLVGSQFLDDCNEYSLVSSVNRVKDCMARGRTLVLINHNDMYESLYDVLNQRTVKKDVRGRTVQMLRLAIGANSHLCPVHPSFRVVVIVDEEEAYTALDVPLLSRFEKQNLSAESVIRVFQEHNVAASLVERWAAQVAEECDLPLDVIFPGFHSSFFATYVLAASNYDHRFWPEKFRKVPSSQCSASDIEPFVAGLLACATPVAISRMKRYKAVADGYFDT